MPLNQGFVAGGTVPPYHFVKASTSADMTVLVCGNNEKSIGISQEGTHDHDGTSAADSGDPVTVYGLGEVALVEAGTTIVRGDFLRSNAAGEAIPIDTSGSNTQNVGARALQSGADGDLVRVQVIQFAEVPSSAYL